MMMEQADKAGGIGVTGGTGVPRKPDIVTWDCAERMVNALNHDYAHCLDFTVFCPKDCFRAKLVRDLYGNPQMKGVNVSWASFIDAPECKLEIPGTSTTQAVSFTPAKLEVPPAQYVYFELTKEKTDEK